MSDLSIFISAGEASGEAYGAMLLSVLQQKLRAQGREARFFGMGGERMASAGLERIVRAEDMAVMGITEVVRHLPRIYREFRKLKHAIHARRPSVAILIDFPDIHFRLAKELHSLGVPVLFFVSPQLWAWKKHRIRLVQRYVDKMLVIFPFEEKFYRDRGIHAEFVGHPLAELSLPAATRQEFAAQSALDSAATWIALLPGSRAKEIRDTLPTMLAAARLLNQQQSSNSTNSRPLDALQGHGFSRAGQPAQSREALAPEGLQFLIPLAPTLTESQRAYAAQLVATHAPDLAIHLVDNARLALLHARAAIVASGTATVEAALIGNPFVVVYRVSPLTYAIAKRVVHVPHVAMANLIAGRRAVPELIQHDFTASNIVRELAPLLPDGPPRQSMMQELARIRRLLTAGPVHGAIDRVAGLALEYAHVLPPATATVPS